MWPGPVGRERVPPGEPAVERGERQAAGEGDREHVARRRPAEVEGSGEESAEERSPLTARGGDDEYVEPIGIGDEAPVRRPARDAAAVRQPPQVGSVDRDREDAVSARERELVARRRELDLVDLTGRDDAPLESFRAHDGNAGAVPLAYRKPAPVR